MLLREWRDPLSLEYIRDSSARRLAGGDSLGMTEGVFCKGGSLSKANLPASEVMGSKLAEIKFTASKSRNYEV